MYAQATQSAPIFWHVAEDGSAGTLMNGDELSSEEIARHTNAAVRRLSARLRRQPGLLSAKQSVPRVTARVESLFEGRKRVQGMQNAECRRAESPALRDAARPKNGIRGFDRTCDAYSDWQSFQRYRSQLQRKCFDNFLQCLNFVSWFFPNVSLQ
jgi:hypothetical protein